MTPGKKVQFLNNLFSSQNFYMRSTKNFRFGGEF